MNSLNRVIEIGMFALAVGTIIALAVAGKGHVELVYPSLILIAFSLFGFSSMVIDRLNKPEGQLSILATQKSAIELLRSLSGLLVIVAFGALVFFYNPIL